MSAPLPVTPGYRGTLPKLASVTPPGVTARYLRNGGQYVAVTPLRCATCEAELPASRPFVSCFPDASAHASRGLEARGAYCLEHSPLFLPLLAAVSCDVGLLLLPALRVEGRAPSAPPGATRCAWWAPVRRLRGSARA